MKVTTHENSLYEVHGATLKHKCGKRIVVCPLSLFLSLCWALYRPLFFNFVGLFLAFFYGVMNLLLSFSRDHGFLPFHILTGRGTL